MTETETTILAVLARQRSMSAASLSPMTHINKDLGIDGDDAYELITELAEKFSIDFFDFEYGKHFGPEGFDLVGMLRGKRYPMLPLSVQDLAAYIDRKKGTTSGLGPR